jgi:hypothetical protein
LFAQGGATPLGVSAARVLLLPPAAGLTGFNVIVPMDTSPIARQAVRPLGLVIVPASPPLPIVQRYDSNASAGVATTARTRLVLLHVVFVDPAGKPYESQEPILLEDGDLDNLPELFQSLPDHHYRIYMKMENGSRRLIKDFVIRNRKAVDLEESSEDIEMPAPAAEQVPLTPPGDGAPQQPVPPQSSGAQRRGPSEPQTGARPLVESGAVNEERGSSSGAATPLLAGSLAAAAVALSQRDVESWNDQVRRTLRASAGKLRRRFGTGSGPC